MTTPGRVALVTGATQGLGAALVTELAQRLAPQDTVYVTGRNVERLEQICRETVAVANIRAELLDVADPDRASQVADLLRERHGGIDIVFSNAVMRVNPDDDLPEVVDDYVQVNNLGTTRLMRALAPLVRDGGRYVVVASSLGTLNYLAPALHDRFPDDATLDEVDDSVIRWRDAVADGSVRGTPWPGFINIPSKIGQVAAVRALARQRAAADVRRDILVTAVCPGMMNTPTSAAFWDVSDAPSPQEAAVPLVDMVLDPGTSRGFYGQLTRDGQILAWTPAAA